jgi:predicted transcriptional regulator
MVAPVESSVAEVIVSYIRAARPRSPATRRCTSQILRAIEAPNRKFFTMDIPRIFNITESAHRIHNPITPEKLATLGAALRLESGARVLDLGSGSGEMLCSWARDQGVIGTGICKGIRPATPRPPATFCARMYTSDYKRPHMSTTLSVRIDVDTKKRLEALAKRARRSKSFLAAEAIAAFVEAESWQLDEIQTGIKELDEGRGVPHKDVANWLRSWGRKRERKAPRV